MSLQPCLRLQREQDKTRPKVGYTRLCQGVCAAQRRRLQCVDNHVLLVGGAELAGASTVQRCHPSVGHQ